MSTRHAVFIRPAGISGERRARISTSRTSELGNGRDRAQPLSGLWSHSLVSTSSTVTLCVSEAWALSIRRIGSHSCRMGPSSAHAEFLPERESFREQEDFPAAPLRFMIATAMSPPVQEHTPAAAVLQEPTASNNPARAALIPMEGTEFPVIPSNWIWLMDGFNVCLPSIHSRTR